MGTVEKSVRRDLGPRVMSALGQIAVTLAQQLDEADGPAPAAVVARELRLLLAEIEQRTPAETRSEIDDLRSRRAAREKAAR